MEAKTALLRGLHDNLYQVNNPQRFITGTILNPDALFNPGFGQTIFGERDATMVPIETPFVGDKSLGVLEYWNQTMQRRTGIGQQGVALDTDALQKQTATASQIEHDSSFSQVEIVARNMAELGWKPVIKKLLKLVIKHQDKPMTLRLHGEPVLIDPRPWNADMDVSVNTGLGTGSRDRDVAMLQITLNNQFMMAQKMGEAGMTARALELLPYVSRTLQALTEATGLRNPDHYFPVITEDEVVQLQQELQQAAGQPSEAEKVEMLRQQGIEKELQAKAALDAQLAEIAAKRDAEAEQIKARADVEKTQIIEQFKAQSAQAKNAAELEADLITAQKAKEEADAQRATDQAIEMERIASAERIAFAKMENDRWIALLGANVSTSKTKSTDKDGKPVETQGPVEIPPMPSSLPMGPGGATSMSDVMMAVAQALQGLTAAQASAASAALAPKRVRRDPITGRPEGIEVDDSFFVEPDPDDEVPLQ